MFRKVFASIACLGLLVPTAAHAFDIGQESIAILCGVLPCNGGGGGASGLSSYVMERVVGAMEMIVIALAIVIAFGAARTLVLSSDDEAQVGQAKIAYVYIITGLAIVSLARMFVLAFSPTMTGAALINDSAVNGGVSNVITYFKLILAIALMANVVLQAFRMINAHGEDEQVTKAKTRLIASFIGSGLILLANVIVAALLPGSGTTVVAQEIAGIANYLIVIIGFMALLAIILAGVMLIISVDESLKDKAKILIKTAIVALLAVVFSYALVSAFILI